MYLNYYNEIYLQLINIYQFKYFQHCKIYLQLILIKQFIRTKRNNYPENNLEKEFKFGTCNVIYNMSKIF